MALGSKGADVMGEVIEPRIYGVGQGAGHSLRSLLAHATGATRMGADERREKSVNIRVDPWFFPPVSFSIRCMMAGCVSSNMGSEINELLQ